MNATRITIAATAEDASSAAIKLAWRARGESVEAIAQRVLATERAIEALSSFESRWVEPDEFDTVPSDPASIESFIEQWPYRDEESNVVPGRGFIFKLFRAPSDQSISSPQVEAWVGNARPRGLPNTITVDFKGGSSERLAEEFSMTGAAILQALVEIWEPDVATAGTVDQSRATFVRGTKLPRLGAVSWFSDQFGIPERVPGAVVLPFANGSLIALGSTGAASTAGEAAGHVHGYLVAGGFLHEPE